MTGDLAIDDTFTIVLQGLVDAVIDPSDVFNLFDFDGTFAGDPTMFAIDATLLTAGGNINSLDTTNAAISQNGQFLVLSGLQASAAGNNVPEPAGLTIWLLFGLTFGAVGYYRARGARIESDPSAV